MSQLSLTDFVDIVSKSGRPKATKVRQVKDRPEYEPAFDFYKAFREHLVELHKKGFDRSVLPSILDELTDPKKIRSYPDLIAGYKKWWGRKTLQWFNPPRSSYSLGGIDIIVNPELGLSINGQRHIIKLYLKSEALSTFKVEVILDLMEHQLRSMAAPDDKFAILDVREAKLYAEGPHDVSLLSMVNAELAYIAAMWSH